MPRLNGALRELSTEAPIVAPGTYTASMKTEDVTSRKKGTKMVKITYTIEGTEFDEMEVLQFISYEDKNGEPMERGLRQILKLGILVCGEERARADDWETSEMDEARVIIKVVDGSFEDEDTGDTVPSASVGKVLRLAA